MKTIRIDQAYPEVFDAESAAVLADGFDPPVVFRPRQRIVEAQTALTDAAYLSSGFVGRYRSDALGRRQFLAIQIPGDFIDLPSYRLGYLDHDIDSFTAAVIRRMPHTAIDALRADQPEIYRHLWRISLVDAAIQRYWAFRIGRLMGRSRIANLFAEIFLRQFARNLCGPDRCPMPITQAEIGDACGMTGVHVNRMLGELRDEGICKLAAGSLEIHDLPGLVRVGQFEWDYLYLSPTKEAEFVQIALTPDAQRKRALSGAAE